MSEQIFQEELLAQVRSPNKNPNNFADPRDRFIRYVQPLTWAAFVFLNFIEK